MADFVIDVKPEHWRIVESILRAHLPSGTKVWIFGSRAKNKARKFSDLDLILEATQPLSIHILADMASDFEDSDLPYKVDLVDWVTASSSFKEAIISQRADVTHQVF